MVRSRVLDPLDLALVCSDSLEHATHAADEAYLLLKNLHPVPLRQGLLLFFVLSFLLLLQNCLHVLSYFDALLRSKSAGATLLHQVLHHVSNLFHEEGHRPFEEVHSLGQVERVHHILVLFNVHFVVFNEDDGAFVVIFAAVIWRAENRDNRREGLMTTPPVHLVAINLDLMRANYRDEVVSSQDLLHGLETELDGAFALRVWTKSHFARVAIIHRVRPKKIA